MLHAVIFLCFMGIAWTQNITDQNWNSYKVTYRKQFRLQKEENSRRRIWETNMKYIQQHNAEADQGLHTYRLGMNEYGDMTTKEFESDCFLSSSGNICQRYNPSSKDLATLPTQVDWRKKGYVTNVKDQGECGSCWAFSSVGALEGQNFRKTGKLIRLSEQNLVDCSKENKGCSGGLMSKAFDYVIKNGGIATEKSYPYIGKESTCKFKQDNVGATANGCKDIQEGSERDLQIAVATEGPISVGINTRRRSFKLYKSGIYDDVKCSPTDLSHAVLVVGYGKDSNSEYWIVKNSWGKSWGEKGYIRMSRNKDNQCGIASSATFPTTNYNLSSLGTTVSKDKRVLLAIKCILLYYLAHVLNIF